MSTCIQNSTELINTFNIADDELIPKHKTATLREIQGSTVVGISKILVWGTRCNLLVQRNHGHPGVPH